MGLLKSLPFDKSILHAHIDILSIRIISKFTKYLFGMTEKLLIHTRNIENYFFKSPYNNHPPQNILRIFGAMSNQSELSRIVPDFSLNMCRTFPIDVEHIT